MESSFDFDRALISHTLEHRGCGIRAASYEIRPRSWLPEACVWLQTSDGCRKLWVRSFAHCFAAQDLTFPDRFAADSWALGAAKSIIDRALQDPPEPGYSHRRGLRLAPVLGRMRHSLLRLRSRH